MVANSLSERALREFYDPAAKRASDAFDIFLSWVASSRLSAMIGALSELTGHEVVLAEGIHALLDGGDGVELPVPADRQRAIADAIARYADNVALSVIEVADGLAQDAVQLREKLLGSGSLRTFPGRVALAGRVLAAVAHEGGFRRSGRDFYMHPDEVASIVTTAWERQRSGEDGRLDVARFLAYAHDGFEDTIDPFGGYLSEKPALMSPFVAQRVLEILGVPDARAIARVLLLMTRTKDVAGNKMNYFDYLDRGIREGGSLFLLTKAPDIHHNLNIEPEMIARGDRTAHTMSEKRDMYREAADDMRTASEACDAATAWVVHSVFAVTPVDIHHTFKSDTLSIQEIAAAVRRKVSERTA